MEVYHRGANGEDGWYETLGHAARLLDVARLYAELDRQQEAA